MKILCITPFLQHPSMQTSSRYYYFVKELSQGHKISLLTPTRIPATPEAIEELSSLTDRLIAIEAFKEPAPEVNGKSGILSKLGRKTRQERQRRELVKRMRQAYTELVQQESFDLVLFHGKDIFGVIAGQDDIPVVVDICDAGSMRIRLSMRYARKGELPWLLLRYMRARHIEKQMIKKSPHVIFITDRDREAILGQDGVAEIIPNMVDLQYWSRQTDNPMSNCIMYSGGMDYRPSVDGALYLIEKILPLVRNAGHELQVLIVGRDPLPELIAAAQPYPDVIVTGAVEDMRPYFEQAVVYAAPLRFASGQQNKLIEAMAMEVPVVTTPAAAAGMRFDSAVELPLLIADDEELFAKCIVHLLTHEEERARLAVKGRQYIEDYFTWSKSIGVLEQMCYRAVEHRQPGQHYAD